MRFFNTTEPCNPTDHDMLPSLFNISVRSFILRNFTAAEIRSLLGQYTAETGQQFTEVAQARIFALTLGQPWLVNALARHL